MDVQSQLIIQAEHVLLGLANEHNIDLLVGSSEQNMFCSDSWLVRAEHVLLGPANE